MDNNSGVSGAGAVNYSQEPQNTPVEIKIGAFKGSKVVALPPDDVDVKIVIENDNPDISFQIDINDRFVTITAVCNTYINSSVLAEPPQSTTAQAAPDQQTSPDLQKTAVRASSPFIDSGEEDKAQKNIEKDSGQTRTGINDSQPETVSTAEVRETITTANPDNNLTPPTGHTVEPMSSGESSIEESHLTGINIPEKPAFSEVLADSITLDNQTDVMDTSPPADTDPTSRPASSDPVVETQLEEGDSQDSVLTIETGGIGSPEAPVDPAGLSRGTPEPAEESSVTEASLTEVRTNAKSASPTTSPVSTSSDDQTVATKSSPMDEAASKKVAPKDSAQLTEASGVDSTVKGSGSTGITMISPEPVAPGGSPVIEPSVSENSLTENLEIIDQADSAKVASQTDAEKLSAQTMGVPNGVPHGTDAVMPDASGGISKSEPSDTGKAKDSTPPVRQSSKKSKRSKRSSDKPLETEQSVDQKKSKGKRKRADNTQSISGNQQPIKNDTPNKSESEKTSKRRKAEPASGQKETRRQGDKETRRQGDKEKE